jgi:hypothetical protein
MNHGELLAEIDERATYLGNEDSVYKALRAVVELHEAYESESFGVMRQWCTECSTEDYNLHYPCPTIQAIEKELQ